MASLGKGTRVSKVSEETIEDLFPNLRKDSYFIASPETINYNCIAWAAGNGEKWWWPDPQSQYFWPPGIPREETIEAFVKAYEILGYSICQNAEYENGFEKIAVYVDSIGRPTHAARQLISGRWTSKLGGLEDIEHTLDGLAGSKYGNVAIIMKRFR
jgi:hypothetical protein